MDIHDDRRLCWICYEPDNDDDPASIAWVSPCACKGSLAWVHQACLQRFHLTTTTRQLACGQTPSFVCNVCTHEYRRSTPARSIDRYQLQVAIVYLLVCAPIFIAATAQTTVNEVNQLLLGITQSVHLQPRNNAHFRARIASESILSMSSILNYFVFLFAFSHCLASLRSLPGALLFVALQGSHAFNVNPHCRPYLRLYEVHLVHLLYLAFPALAPERLSIDSPPGDLEENAFDEDLEFDFLIDEKVMLIGRTVHSLLAYAVAAVGFCDMFGGWIGVPLWAISIGVSVFREHARLWKAASIVFENFRGDV